MVQLPHRPAVIRIAATIRLLSVGLQAQMTHRPERVDPRRRAERFPRRTVRRETAGKVLWAAPDLAPKDQRQALASAAINDLQGISRLQ